MLLGWLVMKHKEESEDYNYRPPVVGELHSGKIVHHSDVDKLLGISDHTEDRLQV